MIKNKFALKIILVATSIICLPSVASENPEDLIEGCKQLVQLSEAKGEGRVSELFTKLKDSPKDSMLAGYCQGMIDSFIKFGSIELTTCGYNNSRICRESLCSITNPQNIAKRIAVYEPSKDINYDGQYDVKDVLIGGCN